MHSVTSVIMITSSNRNIFRVTGHLCGEFPGPRWIPHTKASDAELWCFFDLRPNKRLSQQSWGWWLETPSSPLRRHCNGYHWWPHIGCSHILTWSARYGASNVSSTFVYFVAHAITCHVKTDTIITVTKQWARWRLKSPASRLFTQSFIQAQTGEFPAKRPVTRKMFPFDDVIMMHRVI